jgi:hypothetical protein
MADEDRARRVVHDAGREAPEQHRRNPRTSTRSDHDGLGVDLPGQFDGRMPVGLARSHGLPGHVEAGSGGLRHPLLDQRLGIALQRFADRGQGHRRDERRKRFPRRQDMSRPGTQQCPGLLDRVSGVLRAVEGDDDGTRS